MYASINTSVFVEIYILNELPNYSKDMFESFPDYRKIVLIIHLIQIDVDSIKECGFLKSDIIRLLKKFKTILIERNEQHLDHIKNQEESVFEKILNK